jgi:putative ABC transport system permease protein
LFIALLGILVGIAASFTVKVVLTSLRPTMQILITPTWVLQGVALAFGGAVLGTFYPALRAAAADPIMALAYE